jgi:alanine racemase
MSHSEVVISSTNLLHNLSVIRARLKLDTKIIAVVKANAYGHTLERIIPILENKVDLFYVDDLDELKHFRAVSKAPVMVLGFLTKSDYREGASLQAILPLISLHQLDEINSLDLPLTLTIAVDLRFGREGLLPEELEEAVTRIDSNPNLRLHSIFSHFTSSDSINDKDTALQLALFEKYIALPYQSKIPLHLQNSASIFNPSLKISPLDYVRTGAALYGLDPLFGGVPYLRPVLSWHSQLALVKKVPMHTPVGYNATWRALKESILGLVPLGYSDGVPRALSNCGSVLLQGMHCPIVGRVSMNYFTVDLTHLPRKPEPGDPVVLIGPQGDATITAHDIATKLGTVHYEILARLPHPKWN